MKTISPKRLSKDVPKSKRSDQHVLWKYLWHNLNLPLTVDTAWQDLNVHNSQDKVLSREWTPKPCDWNSSACSQTSHDMSLGQQSPSSLQRSENTIGQTTCNVRPNIRNQASEGENHYLNDVHRLVVYDYELEIFGIRGSPQHHRWILFWYIFWLPRTRSIAVEVKQIR